MPQSINTWYTLDVTRWRKNIGVSRSRNRNHKTRIFQSRSWNRNEKARLRWSLLMIIHTFLSVAHFCRISPTFLHRSLNLWFMIYRRHDSTCTIARFSSLFSAHSHFLPSLRWKKQNKVITVDGFNCVIGFFYWVSLRRFPSS